MPTEDCVDGVAEAGTKEMTMEGGGITGAWENAETPVMSINEMKIVLGMLVPECYLQL